MEAFYPFVHRFIGYFISFVYKKREVKVCKDKICVVAIQVSDIFSHLE